LGHVQRYIPLDTYVRKLNEMLQSVDLSDIINMACIHGTR